MRWLFSASAGLIAYTYLGYPLWLYVRCRLRPQPVARGRFTGSVSILMAVRNEAANLRRKLENLLSIAYPSEASETIGVSHGSSDGTEILQSYAPQPLWPQELLGRGPSRGMKRLSELVPEPHHGQGSLKVARVGEVYPCAE